MNFSNPGDCLPRHLPPSQLFQDFNTCGPFAIPRDFSNLCSIDEPRVFALNCQHPGWHQGFWLNQLVPWYCQENLLGMIWSSPFTMTSILSRFNLCLLFPTHAWAASRQFPSLVVLESKFLDSSSKYICVSFAYKWLAAFNLDMTEIKGVVCQVTRSGTRTEQYCFCDVC